MNTNKKDELNAEKLERRAAPASLVFDSPESVPEDGGGGTTAPSDPSTITQPGNSGDHRQKLWRAE